MGADLRWLQGKVSEDPQHDPIDLDSLLAGLLKALLAEQATLSETEEPK